MLKNVLFTLASSSVMKAFATKLNEYWNEKMNSDNPASSQLNMSLGYELSFIIHDSEGKKSLKSI